MHSCFRENRAAGWRGGLTLKVGTRPLWPPPGTDRNQEQRGRGLQAAEALTPVCSAILNTVEDSMCFILSRGEQSLWGRTPNSQQRLPQGGGVRLPCPHFPTGRGVLPELPPS